MKKTFFEMTCERLVAAGCVEEPSAESLGESCDKMLAAAGIAGVPAEKLLDAVTNVARSLCISDFPFIVHRYGNRMWELSCRSSRWTRAGQQVGKQRRALSDQRRRKHHIRNNC